MASGPVLVLMANDEEQIRTLIERWAEAVHTGDMDGVLADHANDIVMFDVPPPHDGVRGIDAYRNTWPEFFGWQRRGATTSACGSRSACERTTAAGPLRTSTTHSQTTPPSGARDGRTDRSGATQEGGPGS